MWAFGLHASSVTSVQRCTLATLRYGTHTVAMRIAALYDIHGNLPALEAVLEDVHACNVDHVVIGGDVIPGPMPHECIACLRDIDVPVRCIHGNGDREVLSLLAGVDTGTVPLKFRDVMKWVAKQLTPEDERLLASWPATLHID